MTKIAIIGAGGYVFPLTLIRDLLSFPELQHVTMALMDIDNHRLQHTVNSARRLVERYNLPTTIGATTDRRAALLRANYVIITFQVGGLEAYRCDVEIPRRYGVDQTVGDTLGPGGVMRGLRTIPVLMEIARDMQELCPDALLIQYANPMAMNCWAMNTTGIRNVGLCHSVQGTSHMLARQIDVPIEEVQYLAAGINHQAWFLTFRRGDEDLYPRIREVMVRRNLFDQSHDHLASDDGNHSEARGDNTYEGGNEAVRSAIMRIFGYFHTESSHHASEYLPYFRKHPAIVQQYIAQRWDYYEICAAHDAADHHTRILERGLQRSYEFGAFIIHSMETHTPRVIYGNVDNHNLITNLPQHCCVEVPCLVDANGIQPTVIGTLPHQCAAINRTNINVQELAVQAALTGSREAVYHAIALDPLTAALLTLEQIHAMTDELLAAEQQWLPPLV